MLKAENLCLTHGVSSQEDIDRVTQELTNLLVEGSLEANCLGNVNEGKTNKTKWKTKRKFFHPKWHDLSCEEAHRKLSATARLLKGDQKNLSLGAKLRKEIKEYNKLVKLKNKQFVEWKGMTLVVTWS